MLFVTASGPERDTFEHIYRKYKNLLIHKARQITGDHMLAEDAASEAFIRIYRNLRKIGDPDSPRSVAFYVTIVKNAALTVVSKTSRDIAHEFDDEFAAMTDVEAEALANASRDALYAVIGALGEAMRDAVLLKYAHGLTHREIAKIMKLSENNVTVILHRARKALARALSDEISEEGNHEVYEKN